MRSFEKYLRGYLDIVSSDLTADISYPNLDKDWESLSSKEIEIINLVTQALPGEFEEEDV